MGHCYYCRAQLAPEALEKHRLCAQCGSDLHCCKNCIHFDENLSSKCKEPDSPWIADRGTQNTCPYFEFPRTGSAITQQSAAPSDEALSEAERAKERFRALFRTP